MRVAFVIEELDPNTNCIESTCFFDADLDDVEELLDISISDERETACYDLDAEEIASLAEHFALTTLRGARPGMISRRQARHDLPYLLHTGRELAMMLAREKPLAMFYFIEGADDPERIIKQPFDRYVALGTFVRVEYRTRLRGSEGDLVYWFYSRPEHRWRARAMIALLKAGDLFGWTAAMERMQGSLLGYEDWQNEAYLKWRTQQDD